jgi:hypothetical protein
MKKLIAILTIAFFISHASFGQSVSVSGTVSDTSEKRILPNSSVLILRQKDSILIQFIRSDKAGKFSIKNLPAGKFIVLLTYPMYADYVDTLTVTDSSEINSA